MWARMRLFGQKLRYLRRWHHLTQVDLAQQLHLAHHSYVTNLEAARRAPSLEFVLQVMALFSVPAAYLLDDRVPIDRPISGSITPSPARPTAPALFGAKLRHLRQQHRLTQQELAEQLGNVHRAHISRLESAEKVPSPALVARFGELFGVTADYLLQDNIAVHELDTR